MGTQDSDCDICLCEVTLSELKHSILINMYSVGLSGWVVNMWPQVGMCLIPNDGIFNTRHIVQESTEEAGHVSKTQSEAALSLVT